MSKELTKADVVRKFAYTTAGFLIYDFLEEEDDEIDILNDDIDIKDNRLAAFIEGMASNVAYASSLTQVMNEVLKEFESMEGATDNGENQGA